MCRIIKLCPYVHLGAALWFPLPLRHVKNGSGGEEYCYQTELAAGARAHTAYTVHPTLLYGALYMYYKLGIRRESYMAVYYTGQRVTRVHGVWEIEGYLR